MARGASKQSTSRSVNMNSKRADNFFFKFLINREQTTLILPIKCSYLFQKVTEKIFLLQQGVRSTILGVFRD